MTTPLDPRPAKTDTPATAADTPAARPAGKPLSNNERWDADEEPWRHPPVAPKDESPVESLGRSVSDAIVSAADEDDKVADATKASKSKPEPSFGQNGQNRGCAGSDPAPDGTRRTGMEAGARIRAWQSVGALAAALLAGASAHAEWNAESVRLYGGTYAADCANPAALRLRIDADALVVEKGSRSMTGAHPDPSYSFFGAQSPPDFQVALMSQVRTGAEITFLVYRGSAGRYLELQADPKVLAALGVRANDRTRYGDCDAGRRQADGAAAATDRRAAAQAAREATLASPLADREFARLYLQALGARSKEHWLAQLDGPSPPQQTVRIAGSDYVEIAFCKAHDCHDNNAVLLYSRDAGKVYGLVFEGNRRTTLIGQPPPTVAAELQRLWQAEWRQGR